MRNSDLLERASAAADVGRPGHVIKLLASALAQLGPNEAQRAYPLLLQAYYSTGRMDEFWRTSERALVAVPNSIPVRTLRAGAFGETHNYAQAMREIDLALAQAPDLALLHLARSKVAFGMIDIPVALEEAERALTLDPDNAEHHLQLATVLMILERQEDALAAVNHALALKPDSHEGMYLKGEILGKGSEQKRLTHSALSLSPTNELYQDSLRDSQAQSPWLYPLVGATVALGFAGRLVLEQPGFEIFCRHFYLPTISVLAIWAGWHFLPISSVLAVCGLIIFGGPFLFGDAPGQVLASLGVSLLASLVMGLVGGCAAFCLRVRCSVYPLSAITFLRHRLRSGYEAHGLWWTTRSTLLTPTALLSGGLALASGLTATGTLPPVWGLSMQGVILFAQLFFYRYRSSGMQIFRVACLQIQTLIVATIAKALGGPWLELPLTLLAAFFMSGVDSMNNSLDVAAEVSEHIQ